MASEPKKIKKSVKTGSCGDANGGPMPFFRVTNP